MLELRRDWPPTDCLTRMVYVRDDFLFSASAIEAFDSPYVVAFDGMLILVLRRTPVGGLPKPG